MTGWNAPADSPAPPSLRLRAEKRGVSCAVRCTMLSAVHHAWCTMHGAVRCTVQCGAQLWERPGATGDGHPAGGRVSPSPSYWNDGTMERWKEGFAYPPPSAPRGAGVPLSRHPAEVVERTHPLPSGGRSATAPELLLNQTPAASLTWVPQCTV